jgi:hypothetical protein
MRRPLGGLLDPAILAQIPSMPLARQRCYGYCISLPAGRID